MLQTVKLLLPALVPSWRFFDVVAPSPRIEFAVLKAAQDTPEDWQEFRLRPAHVPVAHMLKRIFWNPSWNEYLFVTSCAERLMEAPTDHSCQEICMRIQRELARNVTSAPFLQFRLAFIRREGAQLRKEIAYISPVCPL